MTNAIDKWAKRKGIQFRRKNGQFMTHKETVSLITSSIYNKGIETTNFYSRPFELAFKRLPDDIVKNYGLELENFFTFVNK